MTALCAHCGAATDDTPCSTCGQDPLLDGRYLLVEQLGQGAQGTTFRARTDNDAEVAVKEVPVGRTTDATQRDRLQREAAVLQQLDHPAIPRLHETFLAGEGRARSLYIVQDLVDGVDLERWLATHRTSEAEVLALLDEVAQILEYLHTRSPPVVHRDLKPANLLRRTDGRLVLVDFGSVREALTAPPAGGSTVAGTFGYMAPEQLVGDASPASDLYALGGIAVRLLTRQEPGTLLDRGGTMRWRDKARVSEPLAALLDRLLSPEPGHRPASAAAVRARIRQIQQGETVQETAPVVTDQTARVVADTLAARLGTTGALLPIDNGFRWVDQSGFVEVDLVRRGRTLAALPQVRPKGLGQASLAGTALAVMSLIPIGMVVFSGGSLAPALGGFVATAALALLVFLLPIVGAGGRRRIVAQTLAAIPQVSIGEPDRALPQQTAVLLPGGATASRARAVAAVFEDELGLAGELRPVGTGYRWRSLEGGRHIEVHLTPSDTGTRVRAKERFGGLAGGLFGGIGGGVGGGLGGGFAALFFSLGVVPGVAWLVGCLLFAVGLAAGIFRAITTRRKRALARAVRRLTDELP